MVGPCEVRRLRVLKRFVVKESMRDKFVFTLQGSWPWVCSLWLARCFGALEAYPVPGLRSMREFTKVPARLQAFCLF